MGRCRLLPHHSRRRARRCGCGCGWFPRAESQIPRTLQRRETDLCCHVYDRTRRGGEELFEGQWQLARSDWKWDGSNPDGVGLNPPEGLVEPRRGFGYLWRTHLGGAEGPLGWALDKEYGFDNTGQAQEFERGLMFKGSGGKVYALLNNGRFYAR